MFLSVSLVHTSDGLKGYISGRTPPSRVVWPKSTWLFQPRDAPLRDFFGVITLLLNLIQSDGATFWSDTYTEVRVCVQRDVLLNLPAEPTSASSQAREAGRTSPLTSPLSCLFSFCFFSILPPWLCLTRPLYPSLSSFVLSCPFSQMPVLYPVSLSKLLHFLLWQDNMSVPVLSGLRPLIVLLSPYTSVIECMDDSSVDLSWFH